MQLFKLKTIVHKCSTFAEFAKEFNLNEKDLVITNQFLYDPFMKDLNLPCHFIMQEKYGVGEPSDIIENKILDDVKKIDFNRVIGVGGGTVIDISKLFVLKDLNNVVDAFERKIPIVKDKELIILPSTSGTGSEVTNISIAEITAKHTKMGLADDAIVPDHAVLLPELMKGLPYNFYLFSSIDALIHAVESYVSPRANPFSEVFSEAAWNIILNVFKKIIEFGPDYRFEKFEDMLIASCYAGIAFGNVGVGAVHALSYPLGGNYHVPHGEANYQFLASVFKKYKEKNPYGKIVDLSWKLSKILDCAPERAFDELDDLLGKLIEKKKLREYGMKPEEVRQFAENVLVSQQRLLNNNYVELTVDEIEGIYKERY